jgi:ABC-type multidrug transport system ATPase subunit
MLARLRAEGLTTLVSTPYMDEAARCDRVALIQQGRLLGAPDRPEAVARLHRGVLVEARARGDRLRLLTTLRALPHVASAHAFGEWVHVTDTREAADPAAVAAGVARALDAAGFAGAEARPAAPTIEDAFMALMGAPEGAAPAADA